MPKVPSAYGLQKYQNWMLGLWKVGASVILTDVQVPGGPCDGAIVVSILPSGSGLAHPGVTFSSLVPLMGVPPDACVWHRRPRDSLVCSTPHAVATHQSERKRQVWVACLLP